MSGPALSQLSAHHSIHDAAFQEAQDLTNLLEHQVKAGNVQVFLDLAYILMEHWETRTLRHADMEEQEFYSEVKTIHPELWETVVRLQRDHDLLRIIAGQIKELLAEGNLSNEQHSTILKHFQVMLHLNEIHSHDEEVLLVQPIEEAQSRNRVEEQRQTRTTKEAQGDSSDVNQNLMKAAR